MKKIANFSTGRKFSTPITNLKPLTVLRSYALTVFFLTAFILLPSSANAQTYLELFWGNVVIYEGGIPFNAFITFDKTSEYHTFVFGEGNETFINRPTNEIDSVTFYTIPNDSNGVLINGVRWATRNLAAHGEFVANPEDFGALFQWGRKGDGHEQRDGTLTWQGPVSGCFDEYGQVLEGDTAYGKFICANDFIRDWRSPQINTLWNSGTDLSPKKTANDPCPIGWRVPTGKEIESLADAMNAIGKPSSLNGIFGRSIRIGTRKLFLPAAGERDFFQGEVLEESNFYQRKGDYWSSGVTDNINVQGCGFSGKNMMITFDAQRASGFSIRCVKE